MIPEAIEEKGQVYVHVNKLLEEREKTTRSMLELERYKNIVDELIEYGDNCLENLKDQDNYMCESIDVVGLMQMIHIMYLDKLKELKGEKNG